jgi:hypothetical protein
MKHRANDPTEISKRIAQRKTDYEIVRNMNVVMHVVTALHLGVIGTTTQNQGNA